MSNTAQRKRRSAGGLPGSGCPKLRGCARRAAHANTRASRVAGRRAGGPPGVPAAPAAGETIDVTDNLEDSVEEVVDLTAEAAEASHVVDLTSGGDSVLLVDEGEQSGGRNASGGGSYVVSSDDDEAPPPAPGADVLASLQTRRSSRMTPGTVSCPVCMDTYTEMVESGRLVVSTKCGHVFCSQCLRDALRRSLTCPTCRKRLTPRQYHPLYI